MTLATSVNETLVSGNRTGMDGWTVRSMADLMAVGLVAVRGETEMCSSSTTL